MTADDRPWWRSFFDAEYRRLWAPVSGPERTAHELEGLVPMLATWQAERGRPLELADLCGGDGRLARPLAAATDHTVVVVDASPDMLAHGARAPDGRLVAWLCADVREVPLRDRCVDAALCFFTSLGLCDDDHDHLRMLAEMARILRPGGRLVLELTHRDFAARLAERNTWFTLDDGTTVMRSFDLDPLSGRTRESLRVVGPDTSLERHWSVRLFTPTDLGRMLRAVGLEPEGFYGDTDQTPFDPHEPRLVVVARRRDRPDHATQEVTEMARRATTWRDLVERMRCPQTGQPLELLDGEALEALTTSGRLHTAGGEPIQEVLDAVLVRSDRQLAYPVRGDLPILLADEALTLLSP